VAVLHLLFPQLLATLALIDCGTCIGGGFTVWPRSHKRLFHTFDQQYSGGSITYNDSRNAAEKAEYVISRESSLSATPFRSSRIAPPTTQGVTAGCLVTLAVLAADTSGSYVTSTKTQRLLIASVVLVQ
jgi:hypothetical protein